MTDKQIINGIKYEKLTQDQLHDLSQWELVDIILAYRKDLKAKKKECKELNEELYYWVNGEYCDNKCNVVKELDQLKAELTRANCQIADDEILQCDMREAIEGLKAENENWQKEYWKLEQGNDFWAEKNSRLRGCLTEIKEIAQVNSINTCWTAINTCANCEEQNECEDQSPFTKLKQILQKISEVEE